MIRVIQIRESGFFANNSDLHIVDTLECARARLGKISAFSHKALFLFNMK